MLQKGEFRFLREVPLSVEEHRLRRAIHGTFVFTRLDIMLGFIYHISKASHVPDISVLYYASAANGCIVPLKFK